MMKKCFVPFQMDGCDPNTNGMSMRGGWDDNRTGVDSRKRESQEREGGNCQSLGRVVLYLFFSSSDMGVVDGHGASTGGVAARGRFAWLGRVYSVPLNCLIDLTWTSCGKKGKGQ